MSYKRRHSEVYRWLRVCDLTARQMRDDLDTLAAHFILSAAILYLIYIGQMNDVVGGIAVTILMRFDLETFLIAYNNASNEVSND